MARLKTAFEKGVVSHGEEERKSKLTNRVTAGLAAVGLSAAAVFNMAPANADEVVLFPGAADPQANVEGALWEKGYLKPGDTVHKVPGPYEIGPIVPFGAPHSAQQSTDIAVANARAMLPNIHPAPGEDLTFMGYSLGTIPASVMANEYSVDGHLRPGVRNVNINGPVTAEGIFENHIVKMFEPIVQLFGVPTDVRAPGGSELYGHEGDVWPYSAQSGLIELAMKGIDTFFGPVHAVQDINGLSIKWVGPDGVEYTKFIGPAQGVAPGGPTMGGPIPAPEAPAPAPAAPPVAPEVVEAEVVEQIVEDVVPQWNPVPVAPEVAVVNDIAENVVPDWDLADPLDLGF